MEINKNIQTLNDLLLLKKKKKEPNKLDRAQFSSEWTNLVETEGFSSDAEYYLYNGFVFCGAKPLKDYMQKTGEPTAVLKDLYKGDLFKGNCASTSPILWHLFALYINESKQNLEVLISLIREIPTAMKNKEGKVYGQADRCLKKYLFEELRPDIKLPQCQILYESGLKKNEALEFANVVNRIMGDKNIDYSAWKTRSKKNAIAVNDWIQSLLANSTPETQDVIVKKDTQIKPNAQPLKVQQESSKIPDASQDTNKVFSQSTENKKSATPTKDDLPDSERINQLNKELQDAKKALENATAARDQAFTAQQEAQKKQQQLQNELVQRTESLHLTEKKASEQSQLLSAEKKKNEDLEASLMQQKDLVEKSMEMVEILRRDKEKQSDETVKRLASRLRTYYLDYKDAISLEMSIDLGENMRDQLGEVFKILQDAGIIMG